ncbi:MAG: class I SAM-dependent methyltransferase [Planctomycetes bacterium]|nr:class I SAM-dependent methyltransferase [Planctomycetota bacterium]MCW8135595.1 class I SAM-dependent methyltransferase [Planctomycetota bacterium]
MPDAMYRELAPWWPLLSSPEDYAEEAGMYGDLLQQACNPRSVLELGSGGGNNASHMKTRFAMTLVDASPDMLAVSRALNPECEHTQGDMRSVRLQRQFDAVFVHDAIMYMATREDLLAALQTAAVHCKPGGAVLLAPDCTRETFVLSTESGGHDGQGRAMRYLEWVTDPDPGDEQFTVDYVFVYHEDGNPPRAHHEQHIEGLFAEQTCLNCAAPPDLSRAA